MIKKGIVLAGGTGSRLSQQRNLQINNCYLFMTSHFFIHYLY